MKKENRMKESTKEALKQATEAIANAAQHLKDEAKEFYLSIRDC